MAFLVGGSIPLARYDTNRGAIERAQAERTAADADLLTSPCSLTLLARGGDGQGRQIGTA